jgi:hypothetical protein
MTGRLSHGIDSVIGVTDVVVPSIARADVSSSGKATQGKKSVQTLPSNVSRPEDNGKRTDLEDHRHESRRGKGAMTMAR